jgi:hypothetical protein
MTDSSEPKRSYDDSLEVALQALVLHDASTDLRARVMREIGRERPPLVSIVGWRLVPWAAGIVIVLVGLAYVFHRFERGETSVLRNNEPAVTAPVLETRRPKQEPIVTPPDVHVARAEPSWRTHKPHRNAEPVERLAPWPVPDTFVNAAMSWDGIGPPPISDPPEILVPSLELQSVDIGVIRIEPLRPPEPIVLREDEES